MASLSEMAKAQAPRTFELAQPLTLEELFEKMQARAAAFQMPFDLKKGIGGPHIAFKKEKVTDVIVHVSIKENTVKITPLIQENTSSVGVGGISMRTDKNSLGRKGVKGMLDLPMQRGAYTDKVMETIQKIIAGEEVEDFVHPTQEEVQAAISPPRSWLVTLLLCIFLGGLGIRLAADGRRVRHRLADRLYQDSGQQVHRQGRQTSGKEIMLPSKKAVCESIPPLCIFVRK